MPVVSFFTRIPNILVLVDYNSSVMWMFNEFSGFGDLNDTSTL